MLDCGVRTISLTKGMVALVDEDDYHVLVLRKWFIAKPGAWPYAATHRLGTRNGVDLMHRMLTGAQRGQYVDHINGNSLDNRMSNLRVCTNAENLRNMRPRNGGTSKFKGVYWNVRDKRWRAQIMHNYKKLNLGNYESEEEAGRAYDEAALRLFGQFARLNFPVEVTT